MKEQEHILFLDIETVPLTYRYADLPGSTRALWDLKWQYKPDISPELHYEKAGIFAEFAKVVCVGLGFYNAGKFRLRAITSDSEREILTELSELMKQHFDGPGQVLCAHNGKEFDYPFLCRRFLINGISLPKPLQLQGKRPWEIRHLDTMDLWKFGDIKNYSSLNLLAHVMGIPSPKNDMDGSRVSRTYYEERNLQKIADYCKKDVITLARVYGRFAGCSELRDEDIIFV